MQFPTHVGTLVEHGKTVRYLGYADGVYQQIDGQMIPYAPWSRWPESDAAQALAPQVVRLPVRSFRAVVSRVRRLRGSHTHRVPVQLLDDLLAACATMQEALDKMHAEATRAATSEVTR